jgi:hypothetical protein
MTATDRTRYLRYALILVGVTYIAGIFPLTRIWPSGWSWGHSHYLAMILGVYATLGVFLLAAARDPLANRSLIWFTVWSNLVHAGIMAYQAIIDPAQRGHLFGDVPGLAVFAVLLAALTPRTASAATPVSQLGARRAA